MPRERTEDPIIPTMLFEKCYPKAELFSSICTV